LLSAIHSWQIRSRPSTSTVLAVTLRTVSEHHCTLNRSLTRFALSLSLSLL
jgi:hypothetical protein